MDCLQENTFERLMIQINLISRKIDILSHRNRQVPGSNKACLFEREKKI